MIVLLPGGEVAAEQLLQLGHDEAHHLRVRRAEPGQHVTLRDGAGLTGEAVLLESTPKHALIRLVEVGRVPEPAPLELLVAAGDKERFGWLVEKAAELGVTRVVPLETERSGAVATRLRESHLDRLRRQAREALKQCGAAWAPEIAAPIGLDGLAAVAVAGELWLGDRAGEPPPSRLDGGPVTVVIGPEGGLTIVEREAVLAARASPVVLGPHTLRFETAALAAAAAVAAARLRGTHG